MNNGMYCLDQYLRYKISFDDVTMTSRGGDASLSRCCMFRAEKNWSWRSGIEIGDNVCRDENVCEVVCGSEVCGGSDELGVSLDF